MRRRRSHRHLTAIAAGSGLITLAVAISGITPVWLAVGPLLLVTLDTVACSPLVRPRLSSLVVRLLRHAHLAADDWGRSADAPVFRAELRAARAELTDAPLRRVLWELRLLRDHPFSYLLVFITATSFILAGGGITRLESHPGAPLGVALISTGAVLFTVWSAFAMLRIVDGPTIHYAASPLPWLQDEMNAAAAAMPLLIFSFSDESDPASISALLALATPRSRGHALVTDDHKMLVTGSASDLARLVNALSVHIPAARRAALCVGRAEYPQDGTTPDALLSAATARLTPIDEADLGSSPG